MVFYVFVIDDKNKKYQKFKIHVDIMQLYVDTVKYI